MSYSRTIGSLSLYTDYKMANTMVWWLHWLSSSSKQHSFLLSKSQTTVGKYPLIRGESVKGGGDVGGH